MSQIKITEVALQGIQRCQSFLESRNTLASQRAANEIAKYIQLLKETPEIGRPLSDHLRELIIPFGDSGYAVLYRYEAVTDICHVLAFKHQKEVGY
ncbi:MULTISPECIES: type II toxin-antitoxin system RelE/ParE family toxin [Cysteiniphilum]|uniref:type II toxin-antitoxin system RelE/ParE family toxin n=1 Tax=Cysteiniphilum TaxID=2056696 RepID=UPI001786B698|nr:MULTISPECIES: type II toxin-antitoxin system RelE/ParE family toxin [Cysteiniphilum]